METVERSVKKRLSEQGEEEEEEAAAGSREGEARRGRERGPRQRLRHQKINDSMTRGSAPPRCLVSSSALSANNSARVFRHPVEGALVSGRQRAPILEDAKLATPVRLSLSGVAKEAGESSGKKKKGSAIFEARLPPEAWSRIYIALTLCHRPRKEGLDALTRSRHQQ